MIYVIFIETRVFPATIAVHKCQGCEADTGKREKGTGVF